MSATPIPLDIRCAVCGTQRQATNHWYAVDCLVNTVQYPVLSVTELDAVLAKMLDGGRVAAACGEKCVHILVSRWLETRSFAAPAVRNEPAERSGQ